MVGKMTTFDFWPLSLGGGAWGAGTNMWHPETPASYELLPAPLATQIPTLWIHKSGGRGHGGALILDRCRAFDLFASVDAHLCTWGSAESGKRRERCGEAWGILDAVQSPKVTRARCSLGYLMRCRLRNIYGKVQKGCLMQCRVRKYLQQGAAWGTWCGADYGIPRARCSLGYLMRCRVRKYLWVPLVAPSRIFTSSRSRHAVNRARLNKTMQKCLILKSVPFSFFCIFYFFTLSFMHILPPYSFFLIDTLALHHLSSTLVIHNFQLVIYFLCFP